jgi:hypothetical protein
MCNYNQTTDGTKFELRNALVRVLGDLLEQS